MNEGKDAIQQRNEEQQGTPALSFAQQEKSTTSRLQPRNILITVGLVFVLGTFGVTGYFLAKEEQTIVTESEQEQQEGNSTIVEQEINPQRLPNKTYIAKENVIYCLGKPLESADSQTFTTILDVSSRNKKWDKNTNLVEFVGVDKNSIYFLCKKVENREGETFQYLGSRYLKDGDSVYYISNTPGGVFLEKVEGAIASTFIPLDYRFAKDQTAIYVFGVRSNLESFDSKPDSTSFAMQDEFYIRDKNNFYYLEPTSHGGFISQVGTPVSTE